MLIDNEIRLLGTDLDGENGENGSFQYVVFT